MSLQTGEAPCWDICTGMNMFTLNCLTHSGILYNNPSYKEIKMSPQIGVMIVITFMVVLFSLGMAILYRTIKEGKSHH